MSLLCGIFVKSRQFGSVIKLCNGNNSINVSTCLSKRFIATNNFKSKKTFKLSLMGIAVGALVGTGYSIHHLNKPHAHIINVESSIPVIKEIPKISPSRQIKMDGDKTGLKLTLYQYQTCPFCCKVRAFLDYYGISYDVIEVDPVLRQAIKWSPYKKVPILLVQVKDGHQPLNDSSMIISAISSYMKDTTKDMRQIVGYYPFISFVDDDGKKRSEIMNRYFLMLQEKQVANKSLDEMNEERKWRKWADEVLVHTLSPNVYRTREEAFQAFNWFSDAGDWEDHFPTWERYLMIYIGAVAMWGIGKSLKKKYRLKEDVRQSLYDECNQWVRAIKIKGTTFMGGNKPNLADLAVYGVLNSIEGCDAFKDLLKNTNIKPWYTSMKDSVQNHQGSLFTS